MTEGSMPQQVPRDVYGALRLYVLSNQTPDSLRNLKFFTTPPPSEELDLRFDSDGIEQKL